MRNAYKTIVGKLESRGCLGDMGLDRIMILLKLTWWK